MSIILVCGDENSGYRGVLQSLRDAGLADAEPSKREQFSPLDIAEGVCTAYGIDRNDPGAIAQVELGKVWQALSVDLMLANLERSDWGWGDARLVYLLDHWRDFDPQVKFVLVYSSPEESVAELLAGNDASPERVKQSLGLWAAVNSELLRFYHGNKDRCLLVNAAVVDKDAGFFLGLARDHLKVRLGENRTGDGDGATPRAPFFDLIASLLVEEATAAQDLYQELESSADLPGAHGAAVIGEGAGHRHNALPPAGRPQDLAPRELAFLVWEQFHALRGAIDTAEAGARESDRQLAETREEKETLLAELRQARDEIATTVRKLQEQSAETARQSDLVDGQRKRIAALEEEVRRHGEERLSRDPAKDLAAADVVARPAGELGHQVGSLAEENELLVLQLQQLQEELETYFVKYQDAIRGERPAETSAPQPAAATPAPAGDAAVDLRDFIEGDNWYYAEHDGRWSGPGTTSRLRLPAVAPGDYRLELEIVDAMSADIVRGLSVALDGRQLKLRGDRAYSGSWLTGRRKKLKYPLVLTADVAIADAEGARLEFRLPATISPSSRGSADRRELGIRLRAVRLVKR